LFFKGKAGCLIAALIHIASYIVYANIGFVGQPRFSLMCWAFPAYYFEGSNKMWLPFGTALFFTLFFVMTDMCKSCFEKYEL
jgi:hypothetical protein